MCIEIFDLAPFFFLATIGLSKGEANAKFMFILDFDENKALIEKFTMKQTTISKERLTHAPQEYYRKTF